MKYEEFITQVQEKIRFHLPEEFERAEITVNQITKNNDRVLDTLNIRKDKRNTAPNIYLQPLYQRLQQGVPMDTIMEETAGMFLKSYMEKDFDASSVTVYGNIRHRVTCKLINRERNRKFLQDKPHTPFLDLAVIYLIQLDQGELGQDGGSASITITDSLLKSYGITTEELHNQAMRNMETLRPHKFISMDQVLLEMAGTDFMEENFVGTPASPMHVLTNGENLNGAATILDDNIRQEIAKKTGAYYILPSSVHEVLVIPKNEVKEEWEALQQMVRDINRTTVLLEDFLSDNVYEYDPDTHVMSLCGQTEK